MATELETATDCIVTKFRENAILDTQNDDLQQKEFKRMMKEHTPPFLDGNEPEKISYDEYIHPMYSSKYAIFVSKYEDFTKFSSLFRFGIFESEAILHFP